MAYVIRRYSNRKLYDIQESRYVTLEELEAMIRSGKEISVIDADTGADTTSVTLAQIILESERSGRGLLPTTFLHQLIKHGETWQEFVRGTLQSSLEGIIASQREADQIFKAWTARSGLIPPEERADRTAPPGSGPEAEGLRTELDALRERLAKLEAMMGKKKR